MFRVSEPTLVVTVNVVLHIREPGVTPAKLPSITSCIDEVFTRVNEPVQTDGSPGPIGGIQAPPCGLLQLIAVNETSAVSSIRVTSIDPPVLLVIEIMY
jgi:hypothetical protein